MTRYGRTKKRRGIIRDFAPYDMKKTDFPIDPIAPL